MQKIFQNKIFVIVLFSSLLLSFMFGCLFAAKSAIAGNMTDAGCCNMQTLESSGHSNHNLPFIMSSNNLLQFIIFAVLFIFAIQSKISNNFSFKKYYLAIRDRYGGFRLFDNFVWLFSRGILHPKIY